MNEKKLRESIINAMRHYIGAVVGNDLWREIIDTYNAKCRTDENKKRWGTRSLKMLDTYGWCATTTSAAASSTGLDVVVPVEMGVDELYNIAIRNHIWQPKGNGYGPQPADLIVFKWNTGNKAKPVQWHIGIIEEVHDGYYTTIEGNIGEPRQCGRKTRMISDPTFIGVISPLYCTISDGIDEVDEPNDKYEATANTLLYCGPTKYAPTCNIELDDGRGIRNYLYKGETVRVKQTSGVWAETIIEGEYTWYPWVQLKYLKKL